MKKTKRCPQCKKLKPANEVKRRACAFDKDVNDEIRMEVVCDECEHEHIMDI